jgi:uncharacterized protein (DUF1800 family)
MSLATLVASRFTFGQRLNDPMPVTDANLNTWLTAQLSPPTTDDQSVLNRLNAVQLAMTLTAADGTSTTEMRNLTDLFLSPQALWAIQASDTTANKALTRRPADEVSAARWIRAAFSPWQIQETMVDFWHNHFSVDAYQSGPIQVTWPTYDIIIRQNALGNFRILLGQIAKSAAMMTYLNQAQSVASHPNENFAREVMELHTLGIGRYLGETTPANALGTGYSDEDVTNAARILTGWTIANGHEKAADGSQPNTGDFLFDPKNHDFGTKTVFGTAFPAGIGQAEGETFLDMLARHPGTALFIATKLYVRFLQDTPPANDPLIQTMASVFLTNAHSPNQIALVLQTLIGSQEFAASAGQKTRTPFEFLMALIRATGAEVNPKASLSNMLASMGAPLFHWPTPNGMPDVASVWTGTNDMLRRWSLADQVTQLGSGLLQDGSSTLFALAGNGITKPADAVSNVVAGMLGGQITSTSWAALLAYANSNEVLGSATAFTNAVVRAQGLRRLTGAAAALPEFQSR